MNDVPVTRSICMPDALRREMVLHYWRICRLPTSEIASALRIDEADVCRIIDEDEQDETGGRG